MAIFFLLIYYSLNCIIFNKNINFTKAYKFYKFKVYKSMHFALSFEFSFLQVYWLMITNDTIFIILIFIKKTYQSTI